MCAPPLRCSSSAPFTFHLHALRNYLSLAARSKRSSSTSSLLAWTFPRAQRINYSTKETSKCVKTKMFMHYGILSHKFIFQLKCGAVPLEFGLNYFRTRSKTVQSMNLRSCTNISKRGKITPENFETIINSIFFVQTWKLFPNIICPRSLRHL
jgi:hypothetical protein